MPPTVVNANTETPQPEPDTKRSVADQLIDIAADSIVPLHTKAGEPYVAVDMGDHWEVLELGGKVFKDWLTYEAMKAIGKSPTNNSLKQAILQLESIARFEGIETEVHVRVAENDGALYIDLCDELWRAVKITSDGWEVVTDPPVMFRRPDGAMALPVPLIGGNLEEIRQFVNVENRDDWILLKGFILSAFRPSGPHGVLVVNGEAGSAKSTLVRLIRDVVDPQDVDYQGKLKDERDLMIRAKNSWLLAFDNISYLSQEMSDSLCRLATGAGSTTRKLYSDNEEIRIKVCRPVVIDGIPDFVWASDLEDRSIALELRRLDETERKSEANLEADFQERYPFIFGAICDAQSAALRFRGSVKLDRRPRMADLAEWVTAAEYGINDAEPGEFIEALFRRQAERKQLLVESSPVAVGLLEIAMREGEVELTMSALLEALKGTSVDQGRLPKSPKALSSKVRQLAEPLRSVGVDVVELPRTSKQRLWRFTYDASDD